MENTLVTFHIGLNPSNGKPNHLKYLGQFGLNSLISQHSHKLFEDRNKYYDSAGNEVLTFFDEHTGQIEYDGIYDTYISKYLKDCDTNELKLIIKEKEKYSPAYNYAINQINNG